MIDESCFILLFSLEAYVKESLPYPIRKEITGVDIKCWALPWQQETVLRQNGPPV